MYNHHARIGLQNNSMEMSGNDMYRNSFTDPHFTDGPFVCGSWRMGDITRWAIRICVLLTGIAIFLLILYITNTASSTEAPTNDVFKQIKLDPKYLPMCITNTNKSRNDPSILEPIGSLGGHIKLVGPSLDVISKKSIENKVKILPSKENGGVDGTALLPDINLVYKGPYPFDLHTGGFKYDELLDAFRKELIASMNITFPEPTDMRRLSANTSNQLSEGGIHKLSENASKLREDEARRLSENTSRLSQEEVRRLSVNTSELSEGDVRKLSENTSELSQEKVRRLSENTSELSEEEVRRLSENTSTLSQEEERRLSSDRSVNRSKDELRRLSSLPEKAIQFQLPKCFQIQLISVLNPLINVGEQCAVDLIHAYNTAEKLIDAPEVMKFPIIEIPLTGLPHELRDPYSFSEEARKAKVTDYVRAIDHYDNIIEKVNKIHEATKLPADGKHTITYIFDMHGEDRTGLLDGAYSLVHGGEGMCIEEAWKSAEIYGAKSETKWQYEFEWFCLALEAGMIKGVEQNTSKYDCKDLNASKKNAHAQTSLHNNINTNDNSNTTNSNTHATGANW